MRITVVSEIVAREYDGNDTTAPEFFTAYIAGADGLIVPGVLSWDNVAATIVGDTVTITADLTTEDVVTNNADYKGAEVSEDFVSSYIMGADVYWLAPEVLMPTKVTFA